MGVNRWRECFCVDEHDRETLITLLRHALEHLPIITADEFDLLNDLMPAELGDFMEDGRLIALRRDKA